MPGGTRQTLCQHFTWLTENPQLQAVHEIALPNKSGDFLNLWVLEFYRFLSNRRATSLGMTGRGRAAELSKTSLSWIIIGPTHECIFSIAASYTFDLALALSFKCLKQLINNLLICLHVALQPFPWRWDFSWAAAPFSCWLSSLVLPRLSDPVTPPETPWPCSCPAADCMPTNSCWCLPRVISTPGLLWTCPASSWFPTPV